jgi:hypothetical protein
MSQKAAIGGCHRVVTAWKSTNGSLNAKFDPMDTQLRLVPLLAGLTPTITASDRLAAEIAEAIDAIAERIPRLERPHPSSASRVRGARTVSREFIESMIAAVESQPELRAVNTFDVDEARQMLQFNDAFRHVVDRLAALTASVSHTIEWRKAKVVVAALRTYEIAKGLARDPDSAALAGHLENLRRDLGRTNGGASSIVPPPAPDAGAPTERANRR